MKFWSCYSCRVDIIVVKAEIAQLEQFLLLPQWFLMSSATTRKIPLLCGKWLIKVGVSSKPNKHRPFDNEYSDGLVRNGCNYISCYNRFALSHRCVFFSINYWHAFKCFVNGIKPSLPERKDVRCSKSKLFSTVKANTVLPHSLAFMLVCTAMHSLSLALPSLQTESNTIVECWEKLL